MDYKNDILKMVRNSIALDIGGEGDNSVGATRFGGVPDVSDNFQWPYYDGKGITPDPRPLAFLAQFNCEEMSKHDTEHLLPDTGVLSFFYEMNFDCCGFDPKDKGGAKVFWFKDIDGLKPAQVPSGLNEDFRFPILNIKSYSEPSYPSFEDFSLTRDNMIKHWDEFDKSMMRIDTGKRDVFHKLLGWPIVIQGNMTMECELIRRGYYLGGKWDHITPRDKQESIDHSGKDWLLLFELDSFTDNDFELMLGDDGSLYFYIRREDLEKRNFDDIWLIFQSY